MTAAPSSRQELPLLLVGTDHRCAPLELRERVSYSGEDAEKLLVHLLARPEIAEAVLVSTCNRTEVYVKPREDEGGYHAVLELAFTDRAPEIADQGRLYVKRGREVARHLMAVASGLESMVLGEPEIHGQVKQAATLADAVGTSGTLLSKLFHAALKAGSRARTETEITSGAVSLGYATVELAKAIFNRLDAAKILVVGAGETGRLATRNLQEKGAGRITVTNRSADRLQEFMNELPDVDTVEFDRRNEAIIASDLVVVATGAPDPVVTAGDVREAMHHRPGRPLLLVDLGVPRNIEPSASRTENVFLHDIDSLETLIQRNLKRRREEVPRVEEILEEELEHLFGWFRGLEAEPLIARLQKQAERTRQKELESALSRFPPETHEHLDRLTRSLVRKILHHPSTKLRGRDGGDTLPHLDLVRELFKLDEEES
jgi:glutamyl-tRNA reductase